MTFGEKVKFYREQSGMTQQDLAYAVGLAQKTSISKIELGKIQANQTMIVKIAIALKVNPMVFFADTININREDPFEEYRQALISAEEWQIKAIREILKLDK